MKSLSFNFNADGQKHWPCMNTANDYQVQVTLTSPETMSAALEVWTGYERCSSYQGPYLASRLTMASLEAWEHVIETKVSAPVLASEWSSPSWKKAT